MIRLLLLVFITAFNCFFAQGFKRHTPNPGVRQPIYFEVNSIPGDSIYKVFISYKMPYDRLVFIKDGTYYSAGVKVGIEIARNDSIIKRDFSESKIKTEYYQLTESGDDFIEGLFTFNLLPGHYSMSSSLAIENMDRTISLPPQEINIEKISNPFVLKPLILSNNKSNCLQENALLLLNYSGDIPFGTENYRVLFPIDEKITSGITVEIKKEDSTIIAKTIAPSEYYYSGLKGCEDGIAVITQFEKDFHSYVMDDFSQTLEEGLYSFEISIGDSVKKFDFDVNWINKPSSLMNPENAIKLLKMIEDENIVNDLLSNDESKYPELLFEHWKKYDNNKSTAFNEVMAEFYQRVDFTMENYSTVGSPGIETDRGKVYLKFGEPDEINRNYSDDENILEIWTYTKLNKEFVFADRTGLGNFILVK